jgi:hypothetical protein
MTKEKLLKIMQELLGTKTSLDFLLKLEGEEIEVLVASIRDRLENGEYHARMFNNR